MPKISFRATAKYCGNFAACPISTKLNSSRIQDFGESEILPALRVVSDDTWINTEVTNAVPGLKPDPGGKAEILATTILRANQTFAVSYGTEAGFFSKCRHSDNRLRAWQHRTGA